MTAITKKIPFGTRTLTLETGVIARQASGSVLVDMDGTTVLVTVVAQSEAAADANFFPLRVDYQEKLYAAGIIPGGFFKREGRPTERETLICRLIDRPIRPLFPAQFFNEVQVIATVLSMNPDVEPDILAMIGASAALALSGVPFEEPMGAARVGYVDSCYVLNPTAKELENSKLNLVVAGTESSVLMVESEAQELSESVMLGAVMFGHKQFQPIIKGIKELAKEAGTTRWSWTPAAKNETVVQGIERDHAAAITEAYQTRDKKQRQEKLKAIRTQAEEKYVSAAENNVVTSMHVRTILEDLESKIVRGKLIAGERRIDGRDLNTVRPITIQTGLLPRTHGSALFTRGETQALVVVTLGTTKDAQTTDSILGQDKETFMLHYNFPPFSVGEIGQVGSPKRREVGHGKLAKRGLQAVIPSMTEFPYVTRIVSEITESNGSSSMATVCGGSLALMDGGVPIKAPVAGIAMGLIKEADKFVVLTDILGDEDHLGDMDFKVAGTETGVTALQMDIKIYGITEEIMSQALESARNGRLHILQIMNKAIQAPRTGLSAYAPRIISMKINPEKIKDVIGKGGSVIRAIIEETGASIDITDDGVVQIASVDQSAGEAAQRKIEAITAEAEVGKVYTGKVVRIAEFGAFVNIMPGRDGLVHISQISHERVEEVSDVLSEGQEVEVKLIEIDKQGRFKLSMKALQEREESQPEKSEH
ncbi:MAG TPA: polyribonucleotide nucleotidyltransferase [Gammaproteobacteria bacterium]|nr:polyribonucleotide nucleotidyltransferase [Gammaproteobacteria bacterium]